MGIDVGGTKTLIGVLNEHGVIQESVKIATPKKYDDFLQEVVRTVTGFATKEFRAGCVAIPATRIDRAHGIGVNYANLPWRYTPIRDDLAILLHCPMTFENDAKLGCLSEAMLRKDKQRVLYVTVSTGIGYALVVDGQIDTNIGDGGGKLLQLPFRGKLTPWESFASGSAIVARYGKRAVDITDSRTWQRIAHDLAVGLLQLIAVTEPDVIVFGGSVGHYFERLHPHLKIELAAYQVPLSTIPPMEEAVRPEEAVLYGCYDYARQKFGNTRFADKSSQAVAA